MEDELGRVESIGEGWVDDSLCCTNLRVPRVLFTAVDCL